MGLFIFMRHFLPAIQPGVDEGLGRVFKVLVQHTGRLIGIIDYGIFNVLKIGYIHCYVIKMDSNSSHGYH